MIKRLTRVILIFFFLYFFLFSNSSLVNAQSGPGSISGTVTWAGQLLQEGSVDIKLVGQTTGYFDFIGGKTSSYTTGVTLPADTYTVTATIGPYFEIGSQTVILAEGQVVSGVDFDASTVSGLVKGSLNINAVPKGANIQFCGPLVTDPCQNPINSNDGPRYTFKPDGFRVALLPGDYRVHVITGDGLSVGIVPITVSAGQLIEDPSLNFSLNLGTIAGDVTWAGQSLQDYSVAVNFTGQTTGFSTFIGGKTTSYSATDALPADTYTVTATIFDQAGPYFEIGSQTVILAEGQVVSGVDFDASTVSGLVKGNIIDNNILVGGSVQFCGPLVTDPCTFPIDKSNGPWYHFGNNGFSAAILPGDYRLHLITANSVDKGILPITVTVGEFIDLSTTTTSVPVGQDVTVSVSDLSITFTETTTEGFMTVTATDSHQGGLPPSAYKFLGTYYELTTTATYTGSVTVSFVYDETQVKGKETNLKLFHWDGSNWVDITTSVDTVNNVITGISPTLSPFAIGEPEDIDPPTITNFQLSPHVIANGDSVLISAQVTDDISGVETVNYLLNDGTSGALTFDEITGIWQTSISPSTGVYSVKLDATDVAGNMQTSEFLYLAVYDSSSGFVTGGGWLIPDEASSIGLPSGGKANLGFEVKYQDGSFIPQGNLTFHYPQELFKLKSVSMEWLVVSGSSADFQGQGTINNEGDYTFRVHIISGEQNQFEIRIWTSDRSFDNPNYRIINDLSKGNIVIH